MKKLLITSALILLCIGAIYFFINEKDSSQSAPSSESVIEATVDEALEEKDTDIIDNTNSQQYSSNEAASTKMPSDGAPSATTEDENSGTSLLSSTDDIALTDIDGKNYIFTYDNELYSAIYTTDNWKIIDSYKINNAADMKIICSALIQIHPVHGKDMESYRTPDDMVYEWQQHNLVYQLLSDDNEWKSHVKDVDFDPADQGKSFEEIYEARTGKKLDINDFLN